MKILKEQEKLIENKVVTFNNQIDPSYGWCVILTGGSGMGKGDMFKKLVPIRAKKFDVDDIKYFFMRMSDLEGDSITTKNGKRYDIPSNILPNATFSNPDFTSYIHQISKSLVDKSRKQLFKALGNAQSGKLPNICFDITGKDVTDINQILDVVKPLGYKTSMIWLVGDVDVAIQQNKLRPRHIDEELLKSIHLGVMTTMSALYKDKNVLNLVDEAWAVLYRQYDPNDKNSIMNYITTPNVIKIDKNDTTNETTEKITQEIVDTIQKNRLKLQK